MIANESNCVKKGRFFFKKSINVWFMNIIFAYLHDISQKNLKTDITNQ
jgi:hypothetical protein